jgi:hypothetical protein
MIVTRTVVLSAPSLEIIKVSNAHQAVFRVVMILVHFGISGIESI